MDRLCKPDTELFYSLYTDVYRPQIIRIAILLDIFTLFINSSKSAKEVAHKLKLHPLGTKALLDYLTSLKILLKQNDKYELTPTASTFLLPGRKTYAGNLIIDFTTSLTWDSVLKALRTGQPEQIDKEEDFIEDAWIESYREVRISSSLKMWEAVRIIPDESISLNMLDIACGCAIKSFVLAQKSKNITVTCLDSAKVLEVAADLAERMNLLSQVIFLPGNLCEIELGKAKYDLCLLGQITHYLKEAQNQNLFQRIYAALKDKGILTIDVPMDRGTLDEETTLLTLVLWSNGGGTAYSFSVYQSWLENAGFRKITQLSDRLLRAEK